MSQSGSERRQWPRIPATSLSHITASVVAGPAVRLVNLSRGGALMEVASRFPMRSRVRLKLTLATGEVTVAEGLVAWARVAAIVDKQVNYLVAVIFDAPIPDLGGLDAAPIQESAPPVEILEAPAAMEVTPRDNLSQFPAPVARVPEPVRVADNWNETAQVVSLDAVIDAAHDAKPVAAAIGELSAANEFLVAQLAAADAARNALRDDLEAERRVRDEERARLVHEIAVAASNVDSLQAALATREQEHAQALAEQQARLEAGQSGLTAREQEYADLLTQLSEHQARYEALQSRLTKREQDHDRAVAELAQQQTRCEELQGSLAAREQEHARALAELSEQHGRHDALQSSLAAREEDRSRALAEINEQQARYELLQASFAGREHDHARAVAELTEQQARYESLQSSLVARDNELARAHVELNEQQARYEAMQSSLLARERELASAAAALNEQVGWSETLQSALAAREQEHASAAAELAAEQARYQALRSSFAEREQDHARAVAEVAAQQERYEALQSSFAAREQEHVRAVGELAALRNQLEELESSVTVRAEEHARALADQKVGYDALTAELLQASLDQQAEYQILMDERASEREAERLRGEANALAFARLHEEATQEREQLELRYLDVQARLEAAQSLCAAQEARDRGLRRELEKLAAMVTTLVGSSTLNQDQDQAQDQAVA